MRALALVLVVLVHSLATSLNANADRTTSRVISGKLSAFCKMYGYTSPNNLPKEIHKLRSTIKTDGGLRNQDELLYMWTQVHGFVTKTTSLLKHTQGFPTSSLRRSFTIATSRAQHLLIHLDLNNDPDMATMPAATRQPQRDLPLQEARALMRSHFEGRSGTDVIEGWAKLWEAGDFLPWDRMLPSPALPDTLDNFSHVVGTAKLVLPDGTTRRKRALVPGCGRGVDVMLLQAYGYDVVGLEYSPKAVEACEVYAKETDGEEIYQVRDEKLGRGTRLFVQGDFYADDWLEKAGLAEYGKEGVFELIYDYTFFCAMQPSQRPAWAKRMSTLLARNPQANLVCLEFPTTKAPNAGGPPFSSPSKAYMEHLSHPGEAVPYNDEGEVKVNPFADSGPGALERAGHWRPADTHAIGKDADGKVLDYISVWRHR